MTCTGCERSWNSASMAEGLRLLGSCPRCGGALTFADGQERSVLDRAPVEDAAALAPHMVLGIPRRDF